MRRILALSAVLVATGAAAALAQGGRPGPPRPAPPSPPSQPVVVGGQRPTGTGPRLLWKTLLGRVDAAPTTDGAGGLFVAAGKTLFSLDAGGRTLWRTEVGDTQSGPVADGGSVYVGSDQGVLSRADRASGKVTWRFPAGNSILTPAAVGGGLVYVESTDDNVYGIEARSGVLRWKFERPDGSLGYSAPVYTPSAVYVCGERTLYALDPATGQQRWTGFVGGKSASTPALGAGRAYVGADSPNGLSAFDLESGERRWSFAGAGAGAGAQAPWFGQPVYAEGTVYVGTSDRWVYAVDAATGKEKWRSRLLGGTLTRPALDEKAGVLYVASITFRDNPTLWALDSATGKPLWNYKAGYLSGGPVLFAGQVLAGSTDGYLYSLAPAARSSSNRPAADIKVAAPAKRTR